jgi:oxalate decarboxylase
VAVPWGVSGASHGGLAIEGRARTAQFGPGDVGYVPDGFGRFLENVGADTCRIELGFNDGDDQEISLSGWLGANPRQLVTSNFSLPLAKVDRFPDTTVFIVEAEKGANE